MSPKLCLGDIIKTWLQCNVRISVKKLTLVTVQYQNFSEKTDAGYSAPSEFLSKNKL